MVINKELLDKVSEEAKGSPRLRMNYNFHDSLESKAQRLLNALEIGTHLPIHRHRHTAETYLVIRGALKVMFYGDDKQMTQEFLINPNLHAYGIHIPQGQWHTMEVLEKDTVIFEVKDGPYMPFNEEDVLL